MTGSRTSTGTAITPASTSARPCPQPEVRPPTSAGSDTARPDRTAAAHAATTPTDAGQADTTDTGPGCQAGASPPPTTPPAQHLRRRLGEQVRQPVDQVGLTGHHVTLHVSLRPRAYDQPWEASATFPVEAGAEMEALAEMIAVFFAEPTSSG